MESRWINCGRSSPQWVKEVFRPQGANYGGSAIALVSQMLANLEVQPGAKLFDRSARIQS
jgi:hypothetical protein